MGRNARLTWLGLWVLASRLAGAETAVPPSGTWHAELRAGERLSGELCWAESGLRLKTAATGVERPLEPAALVRLWQSMPSDPAPTGAVLSLVTGDRLVAARLRLANRTFELDLGAREWVRVPASGVARLEPLAAAGPVIPGLGALAEWEGAERQWEAVGGVFRAAALPAVLVRRAVLADRIRLVLELGAEPPPDLWVHFYVQGQDSQPGAGYALHVTASEALLERHTAAGAAVAIGSCRLSASVPVAGALTVALAVDAGRGRFRLTDGAGRTADWTDPVPAVGPGRDLMLVVGRPPIELRRLTVVPLGSAADWLPEPAPSADVDRICLANGDVVDGHLESADDGVWTVRRATGKRVVRLAADRVRLVLPRLSPGNARQTASTAHISLRNGTEAGAVAIRFDTGGILVEAPLWGTAVFEPGAVSAVRWLRP